MHNIKLYYWDGIAGRVLPLIYLLNHSKIPYENMAKSMGPPGSEGYATWMPKKNELMSKEPGNPFINLPYLEVIEKEGDEPYFISQMFYCVNFLAEKLGYTGENQKEKQALGMALAQFQDNWQFLADAIFFQPPKSQKQDDNVKGKLPTLLLPFENCLKFYKKKFLQSLLVGLHKYNNSFLRPCTFLQIGF